MTGLLPPASSMVLMLASVPIGLAVGRLARRAADADTRRRGLSGPPTAIGRARGRSAGGVVIESVTAAILLLVVTRLGVSWEAAPYLVVVTAIVATGVTDLRSHRIPDQIVLPALASSGIVMAVAAVGLGQPLRPWWAACGAALYGGILLVVHASAPNGMGLGDVKLAVLLGAAIGWLQTSLLATVELVVWSLLAASVVGLGWALAGRRFGSGSRGLPFRRHRVPFGPAMSAAAIGVIAFADPLLR